MEHCINTTSTISISVVNTKTNYQKYYPGTSFMFKYHMKAVEYYI